MASDPGKVVICRSGELYIVKRGEYGRVVDLEEFPPTDPMPFESLMAHIHTNERWVEVKPGEEIPELVRAVADEPFPPPAMLAG